MMVRPASADLASASARLAAEFADAVQHALSEVQRASIGGRDRSVADRALIETLCEYAADAGLHVLDDALLLRLVSVAVPWLTPLTERSMFHPDQSSGAGPVEIALLLVLEVSQRNAQFFGMHPLYQHSASITQGTRLERFPSSCC